MAKLNCPIYEIPISYYGRTYEEGKKITAWDGVKALYYILCYNLFYSLKESYTRMPDLATRHGAKRSF